MPRLRVDLYRKLLVSQKGNSGLKIIKGLCSGGVPITALRNPEFADILTVVNKAPKGYKPPSYEKARTSSLNE